MRIGISLFFILFINYLSAQKPELVIQRDGHTAEVNLVRFSPDERQALSGGRDKRLVLWDLDSRKFIRFIQLDTTPEYIGFGTKGQTAVAVLADHSLRAWNLAAGKQLWRVQPDPFQSPHQQGDDLYLVHPDNTTSCWDLQTGKKRWQKTNSLPASTLSYPPGLTAKLATFEKEKIQEIKYSNDGQIAVVALGTITQKMFTMPGQPPIRRGYGGLMVWNIKKDALAFPIIDLPEMIGSIDLNADGTKCLTASSDRTVRLWDFSTGKELIRLERAPTQQTQFSFSADFRKVALFNLDNNLRIFDLDQRHSVSSISKVRGTNTIQFTPDG